MPVDSGSHKHQHATAPDRLADRLQQIQQIRETEIGETEIRETEMGKVTDKHIYTQIRYRSAVEGDRTNTLSIRL